ncbi:SIS domain-containing protein [Pelagovum pacificum]|uniref:SIS domain-containing protein n=1 Tax=Pelagovum pacificum TaxID=2588711 RepID=A0A5C5GIH0_9RHOB|nr:SIS domain-containing protein [Pelagovum pacificum]QQA43177.1 SIS domain-containing protein [Pelagovum pacificum]TNY33681.1 SIS domain-containing protein [Pelagovum pacificum]
MTTYQSSSTWQEITAQPGIWRDWAEPLAAHIAEIRPWIEARGYRRIWLSGAGTSAYVGQVIATGDDRLQVVPTTDFVGAPQDFLKSEGPILAIQFGRSGNSSETVGMLDLLDLHRPDIDRLNITCNKESDLAKRPAPGPGESRTIVLPDACHDQGFAMTSSFTTMLLTALACLGGIEPDELPALAEAAGPILETVEGMDAPRPGRAVFLGAGALTGIARESALKVLELAAGKTLTQWDSTLGYRHGPKAGVDEDTHVFAMIHPDPHTSRYDADIAAEIRSQFPGIPVTTIGFGGDIDLPAPSPDARRTAVLYVLAAQVLSVRWSAELGFNVDDPFAGKNLTRVVSGVQLYPFHG